MLVPYIRVHTSPIQSLTPYSKTFACDFAGQQTNQVNAHCQYIVSCSEIVYGAAGTNVTFCHWGCFRLFHVIGLLSRFVVLVGVSSMLGLIGLLLWLRNFSA